MCSAFPIRISLFITCSSKMTEWPELGPAIATWWAGGAEEDAQHSIANTQINIPMLRNLKLLFTLIEKEYLKDQKANDGGEHLTKITKQNQSLHNEVRPI